MSSHCQCPFESLFVAVVRPCCAININCTDKHRATSVQIPFIPPISVTLLLQPSLTTHSTCCILLPTAAAAAIQDKSTAGMHYNRTTAAAVQPKCKYTEKPTHAFSTDKHKKPQQLLLLPGKRAPHASSARCCYCCCQPPLLLLLLTPRAGGSCRCVRGWRRCARHRGQPGSHGSPAAAQDKGAARCIPVSTLVYIPWMVEGICHTTCRPHTAAAAPTVADAHQQG